MLHRYLQNHHSQALPGPSEQNGLTLIKKFWCNEAHQLHNKSVRRVDETSIPPYAILSHRSESNKEQVSFQDFNASEATSDQRDWTKIHATCRLAQEEGLNHVWIDTCCFDKRSSAETSESINSMFRWYGNAKVCYGYLFDFNCQVPDAFDTLDKSEWFYRGWTLQELIAPKRLQFYDCNWVFFGTRNDLSPQITAITGIDQDILCSEDPGKLLPAIPIGRRMSWAAKRHTSRVEDKAYSLLGLFDVNIPMLYGEGERAFIRLQEEILKETTDLTIFAWTCEAEGPWGNAIWNQRRGVLAHSPSEFASAGDLVFRQDNMFNSDFIMTNKGLRIGIAISKFETWAIAFLGLNCRRSQDPINQESLGIPLVHLAGNTYHRIMPNRLHPMTVVIQNAILKPVAFIAKNVDFVTEDWNVSRVSDDPTWSAIKFIFKQDSKFNYEYEATGHPETCWNQETKSFDTNGLISFTGFI